MTRVRSTSRRLLSVALAEEVDMFAEFTKRHVEHDPEFAVTYYRTRWRRAERKYGAGAPQALNLHLGYAVSLHRAGDNEKAEGELAAIALRAPASDVADVLTRHARQWHARVLSTLGRFDEAEAEWRELSETCDLLLGADHPDAIDAHENHAVTLALLDRVAEAEMEMAGVVQKWTAANGSDDIGTLQSRTSHAVYLDTLGRHTESEAAWRGLAEAKGRVLGSDHAETIAAHERLAVTLYAQGRLPEAAAEYGEVMALRVPALGDDHPDTRRAREWRAAIERELSGPAKNGTS
jgi:hypothetical protein